MSRWLSALLLVSVLGCASAPTLAIAVSSLPTADATPLTFGASASTEGIYIPLHVSDDVPIYVQLEFTVGDDEPKIRRFTVGQLRYLAEHLREAN